MFKYLIFLLLAGQLFAAVENGTVDLHIREAEYKRPPSGTGIGGTISFYEFNMLRDGMYLNVINQKKIFDSKIFIRPSFVGFSSNLLNMGFTLDPESILSKIQISKVQNSKLSITERFFNFTGQYFEISDDAFNFKLNKFRFFCTSAGEEYKSNSTSPSGIIAGCLKYARLNSDREGESSPVEVNYSVPEEGKNIKSKFMVDTLLFEEDNIDAKIKGLKGSLNHYKISSDFTKVTCQKDPKLSEINPGKLVSDCIGNFDGKATNLNILNEESTSVYHFDIDLLSLREDLVKLDAPNFKYYGKNEPTALIGLKAECERDENTDLLDMVSIIEACLGRSEFSIHNIISDKKVVVNDSIDMLDGPEDSQIKEVVRGIKEEKSIKNIKVKVKAGNIFFDARTRLLFKDRKVQIYGKIDFQEEQNQFEIHVKKVRLPFGISARGFLYFFLKLYFSENQVYRKGNYIYVKI